MDRCDVTYVDNYVMSFASFPRSAPVNITSFEEHSASICAELKRAFFMIIFGFTHILTFHSTVNDLLKKGR